MREKEDGEGLEEWDGEIFNQITLVPSLSFVCVFDGPESDLCLPLLLTD